MQSNPIDAKPTLRRRVTQISLTLVRLPFQIGWRIAVSLWRGALSLAGRLARWLIWDTSSKAALALLAIVLMIRGANEYALAVTAFAAATSLFVLIRYWADWRAYMRHRGGRGLIPIGGFLTLYLDKGIAPTILIPAACLMWVL